MENREKKLHRRLRNAPSNQQYKTWREKETAALGGIQGGDNMPLKDLVVNGKSLKISRYISNSLTPEACARYGLETVDIDTAQTDLASLDLSAVSPETYGLIYYSSHKLNLIDPIAVLTGARLITPQEGGTLVEAVTYEQDEYHPQPYRFLLPGSLGCTAAINLGFFLLWKLFNITTRQLGVLIIHDRKRLRERLPLDLPVADDEIMKFCQEHSAEMAVIGNPDRDCDDYPECQDQPGLKCDTDNAHCRPKA